MRQVVVVYTRQMKRHFCMFIITPNEEFWFIITGDDDHTLMEKHSGLPRNRRQFSGMCDLMSGEVPREIMQDRR